MAPRTLLSRIDGMVICASPKASCRSVADFAWAVNQQKVLRLPMRMQLIVFRNPLRRLISAFLNKYVEHSRYREASLAQCPRARLGCFADFVEELDRHGFRCVDKVHFKPQRSRYRFRSFDRIFDADDLEPLSRFVNTLCGTDEVMPFRVKGNRQQAARDLKDAEAPSLPEVEETAPWLMDREELQQRMAEGCLPAYASFYNPALEAMARRVYNADYRFLAHAKSRGVIDPLLYDTLTRL